MRLLFCFFVLFFSFFSSISNARTYDLPKENEYIIGTNKYYIVTEAENLQQIADKLDVGFLSLYDANPDVDPFLPKIGSKLVVPDRIILPKVDREGIVINLAELRLYYFYEEKVYIFPIGIGRLGRETPVMDTYISEKVANPTWIPTHNIRKEYLHKGIVLPAIVQTGKENPLGAYKMRLAHGVGEYLIHGTNKEFGIGLRVSSGCIRLHPKNIEWLFNHVPLRTKVRVINEPIKLALQPDGSKWLEVHSPLSTAETAGSIKRYAVLVDDMVNFLGQKEVNQELVLNLLARQSGIATKINDERLDSETKKMKMPF